MTEKEEEETIEDDIKDDDEPKELFSLRRFIYIFLGILTLMVMFDEGLRASMGDLLGIVLEPIVGFDGSYPVLTLVITGSLMIAFSTLVRDMFIDWVEMAEIQKKTSAFQKDMMEAKKANQSTKVKKMEKIQPEISKLQMKTFKPQIKSMAITMLVIISIFGWLWSFLEGLQNDTFSVPWSLNASFLKMYNLGPIPFPQWIGVYMLLSIPLGQVLRVTLQILTFKNKMDDEDLRASE
ncbi:MAG: DUF106 domain-containing protein [Thermoplasmatota archaeon]